ncbi:MAG: GDP-mannose 4,6-dehydratase [Candidatus Obscuribacterales bacterium]|nr:GDP-mannose 4,6-dehydratase [Candidatus Obscuribacterales bacterium]
MKKRVLITGITGMAGSHLADLLLAEAPDYEIFGTKRWRSSLTNVAHLDGKVKFIDCNLTDSTACLKLIETTRPDYVFHLAAQSFVPHSWQNPNATLSDNIMMQLHLFEAIRSVGIDPVIQIALSSEEYGKVLPHEVPVKENNPLRPLSPYAVSKVAQDMLAYQYNQSYGFKTIRTRAFNHEGPRRGEVFVTSNFAKQIAEIEAGLKPPQLKVGNLNARRDWSDVRDVARAYWLSVQHCVPGEEYVIASGQTRSIQELLDFLLSQTKSKIEVVVDPTRLRPSDVELLQGDPSKFIKATGWKPRYTFEQTMGDLLEYWREQIRSGNSVIGVGS